jgi:hypothetical protein
LADVGVVSESKSAHSSQQRSRQPHHAVRRA